MKKTCLVTGAAGFIGFHVAQALAVEGHKVIGLDNFNDYYSPALKRMRAEKLQEIGINVIETDLNDRKTLLALFEKESFTHVVHLAAQAGVRYARENPEAYITSNIDGFLSILETLRYFPFVKLVYASSSSVYGQNQKVPFSIEDRTDQPVNLYAATKKANELMAYSYHHLYKIQAIGLRYFTVYGPWGRPDMAYFSFTKAILEGAPITLFNDGEMSRDFTYIADVVKGTLAAMDYESGYDVFNIGNNKPVALLTFLSFLEEIIGIKAKKIMGGASAGEVAITYADISHSEEKLGYRPTTSLQEGLTNFVEWYKTQKLV